MTDKTADPGSEITGIAAELRQQEDLFKALAPSSTSLQQRIGDLVESVMPPRTMADIVERVSARIELDLQSSRFVDLFADVLVESPVQKALRETAATQLTELTAGLRFPERANPFADLLAESPAKKAIRELTRAPLSDLKLAGDALAALTAKLDTAFAGLPDFARILQAMPLSPPSPPASATAVPNKRGVVTSDVAALLESAHVEEIVSSTGLTPEQMRLVLVWYVYTVVLLTVAGAAIQFQEAAGMVSSIVGGSAHSVARWCSALIGKSFDKLYPPKE
ncbi:hypothetical protein [Microbispora sp. NBC_01389]|uniref:hypothetical protein n=1 Tax=Microbispora sp. NBC_01389 TaxID=2903584 RepID=UPI00324D6CC0